MCHDVEDMDNCGMCHYEDVYEPFVQQGESDLIFNHQSHIEDLDMECIECHKELDQVNYSFEAENPVPPMSLCYLSCHNDQAPLPMNAQHVINQLLTCSRRIIGQHRSSIIINSMQWKPTLNVQCATIIISVKTVMYPQQCWMNQI